jgi:hypothetical protein
MVIAVLAIRKDGNMMVVNKLQSKFVVFTVMKIPVRSKRFLYSPRSPDRLLSPPTLLSNGFTASFPSGKNSLGVKLTTHLHLVPRSIMVELYFHSHIRLHGVVLN